MTRKKFKLVVLISVLVLILTLTRKTSIIYDGSLDETNRMILTYLKLDENNFSNRHDYMTGLSTNSPLFQLTERVFLISMNENGTHSKTSIILKHEYNIGASGSEVICFNIMPINDNRTRVTIDYNDSWIGMWPPFVWWNPGAIITYRIKHSLNSFIYGKGY